LRDLALPVLAGATTLLAIYAAGLIFVAQHVADRYTPFLYPKVVRRIGGFWLVALTLITLAALALTLIKLSRWTNIGDVALLVGALFFTTFGLFRTFQGAADRQRILHMVTFLPPATRTAALRDLAWSSVSRGDVTSTEFLLRLPSYGSTEQAELVDWITQYSQLLEQSWFRHMVLESLTSGEFTAQAADLLRPALIRLLTCCLDREWYDSVREIVVATVRAVGTAPQFTMYHKYIMFDLAFNLYYIGEEGGEAKRKSERAPEPLDDARDLYLSHLTTLRHSAIGDGHPSGVTAFCQLLERLAFSRIGPMHVSSQSYDVVEDSYKDHLLEKDALESLANMIGACRYDWGEYMDDKEIEENLDELSAHLALYIVALGYGDQLGRMMGNARFGHPKRMPRRYAADSGIDESVYTTVAKTLGYRNWPRN
jgi:hypothetical protein